jgi:proline iminopeptidase
MVRIAAHYFSNGAFLEEGALLRDAGRLDGIPGVLIHGRLDLSCPATTAWELARAWPGAELHIDDHSGHRGSDLKRTWMLETLAKFAAR